MSLGENLKKYRKESGLTQSQLADKIGANQTEVHRWESGKSLPLITTLKKLSIALGISVDNLLFTNEEKQKFKVSNKELMSKIQDIENLKSEDRDAILRMIDAFKLKANT